MIGQKEIEQLLSIARTILLDTKVSMSWKLDKANGKIVAIVLADTDNPLRREQIEEFNRMLISIKMKYPQISKWVDVYIQTKKETLRLNS